MNRLVKETVPMHDWPKDLYILRRWWKWLVIVSFGLLLTPFVAWSAATLENPAPGSIKSGVGVISGWICDAEELEVSFDGGPRKFVPYGSERIDTAGVCGDANNGFGLLFNYNNLGDGPHTVTLYADGTVVTQVNFNVQTLGTNFLRGVIGQGTISLSNETAVHVQWEETTQGFVIVGYGTQAVDESAGEVCTQAPVEAETECHQMQTRIDTLQEDMEYMQGVLDDSAAGCIMYEDEYEDETVPGGYITERAGEDWTLYCIDKDVFNVGPCIEESAFGFNTRYSGKMTLHISFWARDISESFYSQKFYSFTSADKEKVTIKYKTSSAQEDKAIVLGPASNGAYFIYGGWGDGYEHTFNFYRVLVMGERRGYSYSVSYDPETETSTLQSQSSFAPNNPSLAAYVSTYIKKFLARIEGIIDTGHIPQPQPLGCSDRQ